MDVPIALEQAGPQPRPSASASTTHIPQYGRVTILAVWAAAALPMAAMAWIVAPALARGFPGTGHVPMFQALLIALTVGLAWQFILVVVVVWVEQRSLRWSVVRDALWLRAPSRPLDGRGDRRGGRLWLILLPLIAGYALIPEIVPTLAAPPDRDLGLFLGSDAGEQFFSGNWAWFAALVTLFVLNTVLGEELLFRGVLLPRMNGAFGRGDWLANGVLFAAYHLHTPWAIPANLVADTLLISYPARRYRSTWIGIAVHSAQSVVFAILVLTLVL